MTTESTTVGFDEYLLGRSSEERRRLSIQALLWEETTRCVFKKIGLGAGMNCLDVGCGPGEVMRLMGEVVGPEGAVTGLDADGVLGREALAVLRNTTNSYFSFAECDLETIDQAPGEPFDLVYAQLILLHVADPLELLRKMYSWTKPGGHLVVQEYDLRTPDIYPRLATWLEFEKIVAMIETLGRDLKLGLKLPAYFAQAGLGPPDGTNASACVWPLEQSVEQFLGVYRSLLPRALQMGITTEARSRAFFEEMTQAAAKIARASCRERV